MTELADIGLIGLAVMGENLALNIESRGYRVAVSNRTTEKIDRLLEGRAAGKNMIGCHTVEELVENLASPRKIIILVKAGPAVDALIDQLVPLLDAGDIIIDSGIPTLPIPNGEQGTSKSRVYCSSAPASPAVKREHSRAPA